MEKLFKLFNKQLQKHGIMTIKEGAIEDASIVDRPNKPTGGRQIVIAEDREDNRADEEIYQQTELKLEDGIMHKATRGKPLTESQKSLNSLISGTSWVVERTFGSIIRWFHGGRYRYRDLRKTHYQNLIESLAYNLKRALQLIMQQS